MDNSIVRLTGIKLKNFKNVKYGELDFCNRRKEYNASILGLYGQNGSGKTALIEALQILKYLLCGKEIPELFTFCSHFMIYFLIYVNKIPLNRF